MRKFILFILVSAIVFPITISAQTHILEKGYPILKLQATKINGNNGVAVTYSPKLKLYYTAYAGNQDYALETFDAGGKKLFEQSIGFDSRGLWYNSKSKALEGNAYRGLGLYRIKLDKSGKPAKAESIIPRIEMPDDHTVGIYNPKKNEIMYFYNNTLHLYSADKHKLKNSTKLNLPLSSYDFNERNMFFTGKKDIEIAMFDYSTYELFFFNLKTGKISGKTYIPLSFEPMQSFNISFCNDILFVFDYATKIWHGFQVFK